MTEPKPHRSLPELLTSCVHCGFCLEVCPTFQASGDENNSPRGRLRLWREESSGHIPPDPWTASYTGDCVGCLACEPACPANVPYGEILEQVRHEHVQSGRTRPRLLLRAAAWLAARPALFSAAMLPVRWLRRWRLAPHRLLFPGQPATWLSTARYAQQLMEHYRPTGPRAALLTGCLMDAVFREINFATIRVLIENNIQVVIPQSQGCCGAMHEHLGLNAVEQLRAANREAFQAAAADVVLANSAGCGLATRRTLDGLLPVRDVLEFLAEIGPVRRTGRPDSARVWLDLPCHLVHGQRSPGIPAAVMDATGYRWQLAPAARDCCGSGGVYHLQRPAAAREILRQKSAFLNEAAGDPLILATSNHVCMMQWHSAAARGFVRRPFAVQHVIQLLDPGTPASP